MFLREFLRLEGRGDWQNQRCCANFKAHNNQEQDLGDLKCSGESHYRCQDCFDGRLFCHLCIIAEHLSNPFHRVEVGTYRMKFISLKVFVCQRWNGLFFEHLTLKDIGLRIQLGHSVSEKCPLPTPAAGDAFMVIDGHGVHEVGLDFCGCGSSGSMAQQLLRHRLYPATVSAPSTAATFRALEHFQLLSFESKCSAYQYFQTLLRETDNTGLRQVKVLIQLLSNVIGLLTLLEFKGQIQRIASHGPRVAVSQTIEAIR